LQAQKQKEDENYQVLNIACVFSPPAQGNKDIVQLQEDLINEKADYQQLFKTLVMLNGVVNRSRGKDGIKFFLCSGGVMFFNDCLDNGLLDYWRRLSARPRS
jgi:hypothetical protein